MDKLGTHWRFFSKTMYVCTFVYLKTQQTYCITPSLTRRKERGGGWCSEWGRDGWGWVGKWVRDEVGGWVRKDEEVSRGWVVRGRVKRMKEWRRKWRRIRRKSEWVMKWVTEWGNEGIHSYVESMHLFSMSSESSILWDTDFMAAFSHDVEVSHCLLRLKVRWHASRPHHNHEDCDLRLSSTVDLLCLSIRKASKRSCPYTGCLAHLNTLVRVMLSAMHCLEVSRNVTTSSCVTKIDHKYTYLHSTQYMHTHTYTRMSV